MHPPPCTIGYSMTPLSEWLRPPKLLLSILALLTLVSVSALAWFGWKFFQQDRMVEAQREQDRREQAADTIVATLRGTLAEAGERVGSWILIPPPKGKPDEGVMLVLDEFGLSVYPEHRLLFRPTAVHGPEAPTALFAEGEALEFLQAQPQRAVEVYSRLAAAPQAAVRAGALVRLGRVLRRLGRESESRAAYTQLATLSGVRVAGTPADLLARHELGEPLREDLLHARWPLTRGQFEFYWGEASQEGPPAELHDLADAAEAAWGQQANARAHSTLWVNDRPFFAIWRSAGADRGLWVVPAAAVLKTISAGEGLALAALDTEGRVVFGLRDRAERAAVRAAGESQLPWTIYISSAHGAAPAVPSSRGFLLTGTIVMVAFLLAGTYFIARAIRHEIEVSRMQSEFVSHVSHEFRSPLTSIRQLSEMLLAGRVPSEDRRHIYHGTLVRETERLQRLVEALLNFGRMEAGSRQYRFEEVDAADLARRVAAEFETERAAGREIALHGNGDCRFEADPEALSVAVRNLVDNALKYSPQNEPVALEWGLESERVAIRVRDHGSGIAPDERKRIFGKFVRGTAAAAGNVKGSGVGLSMVRHIVDAHKGEIQLESTVGLGSTFTVLLPRLEKP
jgi:signal transduction histidine kinase